MRIILIGIILGFAVPAHAGHEHQQAPYKTENCVKVYRHGPTQAQKQADLLRYQHSLTSKRQQASQALMRQSLQDQQSAFERGFEQGRQSGIQDLRDTRRQTNSRRNRYGRRYSTAFYGAQFGSYNRPLHLRRRRR